MQDVNEERNRLLRAIRYEISEQSREQVRLLRTMAELAIQDKLMVQGSKGETMTTKAPLPIMMTRRDLKLLATKDQMDELKKELGNVKEEIRSRPTKSHLFWSVVLAIIITAILTVALLWLLSSTGVAIIPW